jgi:hypothetical protein
MARSNTSMRECADVEDIRVVQLISPSSVLDTVGKNLTLTVRLENMGDYDFYNVTVRARIHDENDILLLPMMSGRIETFYSGDALFTFANKYEVPDRDKYFITVFVDSTDQYQKNDTLSWERNTYKYVGIQGAERNEFSLGQNIPNPAHNSTRIEYSLPTSDEVVFNVQTVSGQILYTKVLQSKEGKQFIELNTTGFAAGVYFYSIEYKGQKIVKRMSVKN